MAHRLASCAGPGHPRRHPKRRAVPAPLRICEGGVVVPGGPDPRGRDLRAVVDGTRRVRGTHPTDRRRATAPDDETMEHDVARPDKVAKVAEVREGLSGSAATLLTHYRGLSVKELAQLRALLRETNAELRIVKNTLTRRAAAEAGIEGLDELLTGPTSLVLCADDPVGPAKAIKAFQKDHPELAIRGGYLDGEVLDEAAATQLADLDSREELLAKLAGLLYGALANTARLLQAPLSQQARLLQALVDDRAAKGEAKDED